MYIVYYCIYRELHGYPSPYHNVWPEFEAVYCFTTVVMEIYLCAKFRFDLSTFFEICELKLKRKQQPQQEL